MSRNSYNTFAIAGVGGMGQHIAEELLAVPHVKVLGLSRSTPKNAIKGLEVRTVGDYSDRAALVQTLRGVDVVISTLNGVGFSVQTALADAAKEAGVKLFVPSEFGMVTEGKTDGLRSIKSDFQKHLKSIDLPYALFYTGMWADMIFSPYFGYDLKNHRIKLAGDGSASQSYTTEFDASHYIAYVLTHLPASQLAWRSFRLEGDRKTNLEVVKALEAHTGAKIEIEWETVDGLNEIIAKQGLFNSVAEYLRVLWATGEGTVGENDNALVPGWKPLGVPEVLKKYYV